MSRREGQIRDVSGTIEFVDGEKVEFSITKDGWSQWGNTEAVLYRSNLALEEITDVLRQNEHLEPEEESE